MPTGTVRAEHEVKIISLYRAQNGLQRRQAGIGDGAGWKPGVLVGVVELPALKVRAVNSAAVAVFQESRVDGGGIALQGEAEAQAVEED